MNSGRNHCEHAELSSAEALNVALATANSFQDATAQADGKANMLLAVYVGLSALVATQLDTVARTPPHGAGLLLFAAPTVLLVWAFVVTGRGLVRIIRPRTTPPSPTNRFAFPAVASGSIDAPSPPARQLLREAWELAEVLAVIAMEKNRHVARSVTQLATFVLAVALWLITVSVVG